MKHLKLIASCAITLMSLSPVFAQSQPWEAPFTDTNAMGQNVIALWHFDANAPGKDASGHGHDLALRGKDSHFVEDGKFGGALEVDDKTEPGDTRQGAAIKDAAGLNPQSAFTVEMWMSPSGQLADKSFAVLLDKKNYIYASDKPIANTGYLLGLRKADGGKFTLEAQLGFGKDSSIIESSPQTFEGQKWYHVAFTYNGEGECTFYVGSTRVGDTQLQNRGGVTPGTYPVVIGDRVGSTGWRFYGRIDEVRILNEAVRYVSGKVILKATGYRTAFYRMEKNATTPVQVFNDTAAPLQNARIQITTAGVVNTAIPLPYLAPGKDISVSVPLDTSLRPDSYQVTATVQNAAHKDVGDAMTLPLTIVPRPLPNQMPILMWSGGAVEELTAQGYTDKFVGMTDYDRTWKEGNTGTALNQDDINAMRKNLDAMMAAQVGGFAYMAPGTWAAARHPEFNRKDRSGKIINDADALYPEIQKFNYDTAAAAARIFGDMPSWKGAEINEEIRDHTAPSFNDIDNKAYLAFSGQNIPAQVTSPNGVSYQTLPDFPSSQIVSGDNPILQYYTWFWKEGDGWNKINSQVNDGLKSTGRTDLLSLFGPAVRTPSIYGSGGNVDYLNQWTYTYPDPLKVGLATDELFAMAGGHPGQKVMSMVQTIWYRSQTTKKPVTGQEKEWEIASPDAQFISIAPDHLSEATWLELARPVQAIANHGWGTTEERLGLSKAGYVTTNLDTRKRVIYINQQVVKPLGPTLKQAPDYPADVAFLESFASQIFAGTGTYGWGGGWGADSYMIARYAGLQPQIVYDETIDQKGLDQYKVLFLTDCPVLTQSVADAIIKFQQRGGIVIGDENLAPGIQPDILLASASRGTPDAAKAMLLQKATELRGELNTFYQRPVDSDNPEVITRLRQWGSSQYVFTVNDHRTYGDYVGQYKMVMEKGLPSTAQITLNRANGFVYDLMKHQAVPAVRTGGKLLFPVNLDGGEGDVFLVTAKPVGKLQVSTSLSVQRGENIPVKIVLQDNAGQPLDAVVPLQITIRDSKGNIAEKSGYYGAPHGLLNLNLDIAPNDATGKWQIEVVEALTGQQVIQQFNVK